MKHHTTGMVLGKFMPPHLGHQYLIDFARNYVDDLTVLVCSLKAEPIPGHLRFQWVSEMFPKVRIVHVTDENPQQPSEHPDFWKIWHDTVRRALPAGPDYVFASEEYGWKLAEVLGARYLPVNISRELVPISGTAVRKDPFRNWQFLPVCVRPYFVKRVCIFGPESTGKSVLTAKLAKHYDTVYVAEYARTLLELKDGVCEPADMPIIARSQMASEDALVRQANRVLFCDTDLLTTVIWSEALFGECSTWIKEEAAKRRYDLYLLTDVDVPWVEDKVRYLPNERESFMQRCIDMLEQHDRPYVRISGSWESRFEKACQAVDKILGV